MLFMRSSGISLSLCLSLCLSVSLSLSVSHSTHSLTINVYIIQLFFLQNFDNYPVMMPKHILVVGFFLSLTSRTLQPHSYSYGGFFFRILIIIPSAFILSRVNKITYLIKHTFHFDQV